MLLGPLRQIVPVLALFLLVVIVVTSAGPLSLATDVGTSDQAVCDAVQRDGAAATARLDSTGFPHATSSSVETYALDANGATQAIVQLDWANHRAQCLPLDSAMPRSATLHMTPTAYAAATRSIRSTLETGHADGTIGTLFTVGLGSHVQIPSNPNGEDAYSWTLGRWAAGWLAHAAP